MEQDEQQGENYCGIEASIWTAGRETLSAGIFELWTGVLMVPFVLSCRRYRTVDVASFVKKVPTTPPVFETTVMAVENSKEIFEFNVLTSPLKYVLTSQKISQSHSVISLYLENLELQVSAYNCHH
jgi:hypothetical protein